MWPSCWALHSSASKATPHPQVPHWQPSCRSHYHTHLHTMNDGPKATSPLAFRREAGISIVKPSHSLRADPMATLTTQEYDAHTHMPPSLWFLRGGVDAANPLNLIPHPLN
ncbi:hypothetical protein AMTR_s00138p00110910 [Amborella trichopoda]|uniref:Uncharacterized protein n=1 Tax=Amborella trichopoda TaxID=13333 RepID=W1NEN0_AMBTC|nr:hypothetical protein AMTR_s00138p00110910 [Amborella trichopoda]